MSYNIGQFRRDMLNTQRYLTQIPFSIVPIRIQTDQSLSSQEFTDYAIQLTQSNAFAYGHNYYVKIGIRRAESAQTIIVNLQNSDQTNTNYQILDTIVIPEQDNSINQTVILELVFSPNASYNRVVLTLQRTAYDYTISNTEGTGGRLIEVDAEQVETAEIYNVLQVLQGVNYLRKIGVQGPPGLLMCINGQDIRIGPNGIYEIKNQYKITSIGFIIKESDETLDKRDYFILDYQY